MKLLNDFHNTEITLRVKGDQLSSGQIKRAQKELCGISGCTCSGPTGARGVQDGFRIIGDEIVRGSH